MADFDLAGLYNELFGAQFPVDFNKVIGGYNTQSSRKNRADLGADYYATDANGKEYFLPVTIKYANPANTLVSLALPYPGISIKGSFNYVDTVLTDRYGMVSEYISMNNYEITVRGLMVTPDNIAGNKTITYNEFPEQLMKQLQALVATGQPVELICAATDMFLKPMGGKVTLRSFDIPERPGVKNVRLYTLYFQSDSVFDLTDIS